MTSWGSRAPTIKIARDATLKMAVRPGARTATREKKKVMHFIMPVSTPQKPRRREKVTAIDETCRERVPVNVNSNLRRAEHETERFPKGLHDMWSGRHARRLKE